MTQIQVARGPVRQERQKPRAAALRRREELDRTPWAEKTSMNNWAHFAIPSEKL